MKKSDYCILMGAVYIAPKINEIEYFGVPVNIVLAAIFIVLWFIYKTGGD